MEAATTIQEMLKGNPIIIPSYQRAYSWDTPVSGKNTQHTQTDVFLSDLEKHAGSKASTPYYFGHFLFEKTKDADYKDIYHVIDGQQRLTTIVMFLSALFSRLQDFREFSQDEKFRFEDMIKREGKVYFSTVDYDDQFFKDYVIDQTRQDHTKFDTASARRISSAFDFFKQKLSKKTEEYLVEMLDIVSNAECTTHQIKKNAEAVQMFIFQNDRGKNPTDLEIVKAEFMHKVLLYGGKTANTIITEITNRFKNIYKSISLMEDRTNINEDDVLRDTARVFFNSLTERDILEKIKKELIPNSKKGKAGIITFIKEFSQMLKRSFENLLIFYDSDQRDHFAIHSFIALGNIRVGLPFIIKAYLYNILMSEKERLCAALESLILRDSLIRTKADLRTRINDVFQNFTEVNKSIVPIIERIESLKKADDESWWWAHWNNTKLGKNIAGGIHPPVAKYLLWKYENYLEGQGKKGYMPSRFNSIVKPEREHIAPRTEPKEKNHGYPKYTDTFKNEYIDCLGNYLLVSKSHNCAVGNKPFQEKLKTYTHNAQQREVRELGKDGKWTRALIIERRKKIAAFILKTF
ncbi:MAG: DUF262 domain-containing protein [Salinispira sp.]